MIRSRSARTFRNGSRTYFTSSIFFSSGVRRDVFALYAFVRVADDLVDRVPQDVAGFYAFVDRYRAAMDGEETGDEVVDGFVALARRCRFDPAWIESFLSAMRQDLTKRDYADIGEVEAYMHGSAEVIGLCMARILDLPDAALPAAARLGTAMQYLNFLRDVAHDLDLGRTYVPQDVLAHHGLPSLRRADVEADPDAFRALVRAELQRYRRWQAQAEAGYSFIPWRARVPIQTAADMYRWTADVIARNPMVVLDRQVRPSIARILLRVARNAVCAAGASVLGGWSAGVARMRPWLG